ncbi:ABC transporter permease, partial [bacterium]|nr:ABC transporter permease [bacterium]
AESEGIHVGEGMRSGQTVYPVVGIVGAGAGFQDYTAYINLQSALKAGDGKGASELWVQLKDQHRAAEVVKRIESFHIPNVKVMTRRDYLGAANDYIKYAWMLQCAISAIGVLIAVTAAMNTMLMSTYERMREFGTLRAIGASRMTVATMVVTESVILSLVGGMFGIAFGWIGSILLDRAMVVVMQITFPLASVTPALIAEAMLLSVLVGLIGAAIPSVLVWRIDIVRGLKWS